MSGSLLLQVAVFLTAAAFAPSLARRLRMGPILGYLFAGVLIGPFGLGLVYTLFRVESIIDLAELGIALFLFSIGLELRFKRLWSLRDAVFGLGGAQVACAGLALTAIGLALGQSFGPALLIGLALSLSSTAFALQILDEKRELTTRHGRLAFSILLFQDIAAIPMIALVPLFALGASAAAPHMTWLGALKALTAIAALIVIGHYLLDKLYAIIASAGGQPAMTASALLTVVAVALLMHEIGLSASLGAFLAGVLLADSHYRHQLESDIAPFQMLLLGLFFMTIGMSLDVKILAERPMLVAAGVAGLVAVKAVIVYALGRWQGLKERPSRRLALVISQGGEFAFVIFTAASQSEVIARADAALLAVIVTLSMATTPLLLLADEWLERWRSKEEPQYDMPPGKDGHVVIAGFGRFGQIIARILRAKRIPFTALDISAEQVNFVNQMGNKIYYGDASRLGILEAARVEDARAFVLAIDDVETSVMTAEIVRRHFPHVPIYARARNRQHVHRLMDLGVQFIERETYKSALALTRGVLRVLELPEAEIRYVVDTFSEHDERRLYDDYKHYTDAEKIRSLSLRQSEELEQLFAQDWQGQPKRNDAAKEKGKAGLDLGIRRTTKT